MLKKEELNKINLKITLIKKKQIDNYSEVGKVAAYIDNELIGSVKIYAKKKDRKLKLFDKLFPIFYN